MEKIKNVFGGIDEILTQEKFEELCGGPRRASRLLFLWNESYPCGTEYDFLLGKGKNKQQIFESKAKREGFSIEQIKAFLEL